MQAFGDWVSKNGYGLIASFVIVVGVTSIAVAGLHAAFEPSPPKGPALTCTCVPEAK